jgi:hypothetical protein
MVNEFCYFVNEIICVTEVLLNVHTYIRNTYVKLILFCSAFQIS